MIKGLPKVKIKDKIKEKIDQSIQTAFTKGKEINCDIFKFSDMLYQQRYSEWKKYIEENKNYLEKIKIITNIKIDKLT